MPTNPQPPQGLVAEAPTSPEAFREQLYRHEAAMLEGHGLPEEVREQVSDLANLAITSACEVVGIDLAEVQGYQSFQSPALGHKDTILSVSPGFAYFQASRFAGNGWPGTPNEALHSLYKLLPPERLKASAGPSHLILNQIVVARYLPGASVISGQDIRGAREVIEEDGFPTDRGHRDVLPSPSIVESEQLDGDVTEWEVINSMHEKFSFRQRNGDRVAMRAGAMGVSEGRPWHNVVNTSDKPRTTLILVYGP